MAQKTRLRPAKAAGRKRDRDVIGTLDQNLPRMPSWNVRPGSYDVNAAFGNWK